MKIRWGKEILNRFKVLSLRKQLFVSMLLTGMTLMTILGVLLFGISKHTIEKNYEETHAYYMELFSSSIQIRLEEIINASRELLENTDYIEIMKTENATEASAYFNPKNQVQLEKLIHSIQDNNAYIEGIMAIGTNGKLRHVQKHSGQEESVAGFYQNKDVLDQEWIALANDSEGREVVLGYNVLNPEDGSNFSIIKQMKNPADLQPIGYLVITVSKNLIEKTFGMHTDTMENNYYLVLESDNSNLAQSTRVVYHNVEDANLQEIIDAYEGRDTKRNYLFSYYSEERSDWEIVSVIDTNELSNQSDYIKWTMMIGIIVLIFLFAPISNFLAGQIYRPLKLLEDTISQVGEGNYTPDVDFDNSEIGKVGQHFLNIASNNLVLREKLLQAEINERQSELLLLQSQINPHFLYNTLDALYFMAVIDGADDIMEMVKCLSDTFKLTLNKGNKLITIHDELDKMIAYMKIQNLRFQNRFELQLDVEDDIMQEQILTFILQPLVENAVTHGLERKIGNGIVSIVGYRDGDMLRFMVRDNGVGISNLDSLKNGYGVKNIEERIKLFYGEEYDVVFESTIGEGTTVFLQLPIIGEEEIHFEETSSDR